MTNSRTILLTVVGIVAIMAIVLAALLHVGGTQRYHLSPVVAHNFRNASLINNNEAYFYNGDAFMKFNFTTQTATALTPRYSLPTVTDVRWSSTGALFKAGNYSGADQLIGRLQAAGAPTDAVYWWYVSFATGAISPVESLTDAANTGAVVNDVVWTNTAGQYYYLETPTFPDEPATTTLYRATGGGAGQPIAQTAATSLLWADNTHVLYQIASGSTNGVQRLDTATLKASELLTNFQGQVQADSTGSRALAVAGSLSNENAAVSGPLTLRNLSTGDVTDVAKSFSGSLAWSHDGSSWVAADSSNPDTPAIYLGSITGAHKLALTLPAHTTPPSDLVVAGYEGGSMLLTDGNNDAYLAAASLPSFKTAPSNSDAVTLSGDGALTSQGVTSAQIDDLKVAVNKYGQAAGYADIQAVIGNVQAAPVDPNSTSPVASYTFDLTYGSNPAIEARLDCDGLSAARLVLTSAAGQPLYDSGSINLTGN